MSDSLWTIQCLTGPSADLIRRIVRFLVFNASANSISITALARKASKATRFRAAVTYKTSNRHIQNLTLFLHNLLHEMLDFLPLRDVVSFGHTSRLYRRNVMCYLDIRINGMLKEWFRFPSAFRDTMRETHALISGSAALSFILASPWKPNDLDLVVGRDERAYRRLRSHLTEREGYKVVRVFGMPVPPDHEDSDGEEPALSTALIPVTAPPVYSRAIHRVTKLRRTTQANGENYTTSIDLISSATHSAADPIFRFHSTGVMNFISADAVYVGYPKLTYEHRALAHPNMIFSSGAAWFEKYVDRGFLIFRNTSTSHTRCGVACPTILRSVADVGGMFVTVNYRPPDGTFELFMETAWALTASSLHAASCPNPLCGRFIMLQRRDFIVPTTIPMVF